MNSLIYNIKQGFTQILRNRGMSVASIFSILAMLFILGLFFVIVVNLNLFTEVVKQDYDQVEVYLKDEVSMERAEDLMAQIQKYEGVSSVAYRSEDDALEILKQRWGESGYLLDSLGENPLPASILISRVGEFYLTVAFAIYRVGCRAAYRKESIYRWEYI